MPTLQLTFNPFSLAFLINLTHSKLDFPVVITSSIIKTFAPFLILNPLLNLNFPFTLSQKIVSLFNNKIFGVDSGIKYGLDGEILIVKNKKFYRGDLNGKLTEF